jgi:hypothetical protein
LLDVPDRPVEEGRPRVPQAVAGRVVDEAERARLDVDDVQFVVRVVQQRADQFDFPSGLALVGDVSPHLDHLDDRPLVVSDRRRGDFDESAVPGSGELLDEAHCFARLEDRLEGTATPPSVTRRVAAVEDVVTRPSREVRCRLGDGLLQGPVGEHHLVVRVDDQHLLRDAGQHRVRVPPCSIPDQMRTD